MPMVIVAGHVTVEPSSASVGSERPERSGRPGSAGRPIRNAAVPGQHQGETSSNQGDRRS